VDQRDELVPFRRELERIGLLLAQLRLLWVSLCSGCPPIRDVGSGERHRVSLRITPVGVKGGVRPTEPSSP